MNLVPLFTAALARLDVGGCRLPPPAPGTQIDGNFRSYAKSPFAAWTGMWGLYLPQNDTLKASSSMRVIPDTFPHGTVLAWDVTPDPDWAGVNGFLHVSWGNYDDSPGRIVPRQVRACADLTVDAGWVFTGDSGSGLLAECWLSPVAAPAGSFTKSHEVAFLPKVSPSAAVWLAGLPAVGRGEFTDRHGVAWLVRQGGSDGQPYFVAYRPGYADAQGVLPFGDYLTFLTAAGQVTGGEWVNGLAFGVEPHHGTGQLEVRRFTASYDATKAAA